MSHYEPLANYMLRFNHPFARRDHRDVGISRRFRSERRASNELGSQAYRELAAYLPNRLGSVLDVGSGFGAGAVEVSRLGADTVLGISNSPFQVDLARKLVKFAGVSECRFMLHDFDAPLPEETFDTILAVESLIHSNALSQTIANLQRALNPSGQMALLEDVCIGAPRWWDRKVLKWGWGVDRAPTRRDYLDAFRSAHLAVTREVDVTPQVVVNPALFARAIGCSCLLLSVFVPTKKLALILRFHAAQSFLHLWLRQGRWRYIAFVVEHQSLSPPFPNMIK